MTEATVFCHPCDLKVGDRIPNHLTAFDSSVRATYLSDWPQAEKDDRSREWLVRTGPYSYEGNGVVIDKASGLVRVLGLQIDLGEVPCDGHVEFVISRLDV